MKRNIAIIVLGLSLIVSACAVGPDYTPPALETPDTYRFETKPPVEKIDLKWWELFHDHAIYTLVTEALEKNLDVKIAASRIEEARAYYGFTRPDQYPQFDIQGGASRGSLIGGGVGSPDSNRTAYIAPVLSWEIDFWGKFRRATESARASLMASEYAHKTVQLSLIAEVVSTYYNLLDFRQRLGVAKNTLESRMKSLDIIQKRFDAGIIPEIDLNQAQIQKEIAAAAIPQYERLIAKAENTLNILLGGYPKAIEVGIALNDQIVPDIPLDLPSNILERRPDIVAARYAVEAQTAQIGVAEAMRFPAFSLTALVGVASTDIFGVPSSGGVYSIGAGLFGPIYNFGKNIRRVEIEEEKTKQALYQYENVVLTAFREVADALVEVETYKNQISSVSNQQKAAFNANVLSKERYDKGVSSYLEVLETERSLFSVDLELSELRQQFLNAYVRLYKALGGGWITQ
jgi:multidrug efflux system outer membrane protein